jgi:hypothetical protein
VESKTQGVVALIEGAPGVVKLTVVAPVVVDMLEVEAKVAEIEEDMHGAVAQRTVADKAVQVVRVVVRGVVAAEVARVMGGEEGRASSATTCHKSAGVIHPRDDVQCVLFTSVFRIHNILVWIRIRIRGSMPLTNGSVSCYFRH